MAAATAATCSGEAGEGGNRAKNSGTCFALHHRQLCQNDWVGATAWSTFLFLLKHTPSLTHSSSPHTLLPPSSPDLGEDHSLVCTVGSMSIWPNAGNVIPG
jgi:hypothetical protein